MCNPYGVDEGPCVLDDQCKGNLFCGYKNCPASFGNYDANCCGKNQFKSPYYPNGYFNYYEKTWLITAPVGSIIILQFHSLSYVRLIVESKNKIKYKCIVKFSLSQTESQHDFVTIYDGPNDQSTQIEKLSGNLGSLSISSTGNYLFVKFESDLLGNDDGFLVTIHYGNNNMEFI